MISIHHVGEQTVITPGGVSFIKGKDDKYVYIPSAYKLYMLIADHHHWHGKHLRYEYPERMPTNEEMIAVATRNDPVVLNRIETKIREYKERLEHQIEDAGQYTHLSAKEREAMINNLRYMLPYRIQRHINKQVYRYLIGRLVDQIHTKEIDHIEVPPTRNFLHVLESIKGGLIGRKVSGRVEIEATTHNNRPILRLNTYGEPPKGELGE